MTLWDDPRGSWYRKPPRSRPSTPSKPLSKRQELLPNHLTLPSSLEGQGPSHLPSTYVGVPRGFEGLRGGQGGRTRRRDTNIRSVLSGGVPLPRRVPVLSTTGVTLGTVGRSLLRPPLVGVFLLHPNLSSPVPDAVTLPVLTPGPWGGPSGTEPLWTLRVRAGPTGPRAAPY